MWNHAAGFMSSLCEKGCEGGIRGRDIYIYTEKVAYQEETLVLAK